MQLERPAGYGTIQWADNTVHAYDLEAIPEDKPMWRVPVVCGSSGPGVSSDEDGANALRGGLKITCTACVSILAPPVE